MTTRTLPPEPGAALHLHQVFAKVERLLGLRYLPHQWTDLRRLLRPAVGELGMSTVEECLSWLQNEEQSEEQVRILAKHLTIGESYFFRELAVISVLRDAILPEILRRKSETGDSLLRVWSAGCSTGEEVYTLAIIIASLLREESGMRVHILGTDINTISLDRARRGVYRDWSFRDMSEELINRWFVAEGDNRYTVSETLRSMVEFRPLNLVDVGTYPSPMDLILCRNVLMYFTRPVVNEIVQGFRASLRPDGWLVPSMTETTLINQPGFEGKRFGDITLFHYQRQEFPAIRRKEDAERDATPTPDGRKDAGRTHPFDELLSGRALQKSDAHIRNTASDLLLDLPLPALPVVEDSDAFAALVDNADAHAAESGAASVVSAARTGEAQTIIDAAQAAGDRARDLADAGRLEEALSAAERAVSEHKMSAYCQCIHATILRELGETQRALQVFDRALYLDPTFIPAHFGIGSLYRFLGKDARAARHLGNALELIEALPDQDQVLFWGDMTARHLAVLIRTMEGRQV